MSDSLIEKMIAKGVNINNFQEVFNFFHSIDAIEVDLVNLLKPYLLEVSQEIVNQSMINKADRLETELALSLKLNKNEYNDHFKGLFKSYAALVDANIQGKDGDYAHIDVGSGFGRVAAIYDTDDQKWVVIEVNVAINTDEMPEGAVNLYFNQDRVKNTLLSGLVPQNPTDITQNDSIIVALAKLQAQLKSKPTEPVWVDAAQVLDSLNPNITYSTIVHGKPSKLEFLKANGMLYIRGGFTVKQEMSQVIFGVLKNEYKIKYAIDLTVLEQYVTWQMSGSTATGKMFVYTFNPIDKLVDAQNVRQELKSAVGLIARNYHVFGCLGAVVD